MLRTIMLHLDMIRRKISLTKLLQLMNLVVDPLQVDLASGRNI